MPTYYKPWNHATEQQADENEVLRKIQEDETLGPSENTPEITSGAANHLPVQTTTLDE